MTLPYGPRSRQPDTGVGVLDRSVAVLDAVEAGARTFTELVAATGFARATTHRLLKALEEHGFLAFTDGLGYRLGPRLFRLAATAMRELPLRDLAHPALERLSMATGESAQLYVNSGNARLCIDAVESDNELRTIVPVGAELPLTAGSGGKAFLAWMEPHARAGLVARAERLTAETPVGTELERELALIRRRGWAGSAGERQPGVGSVSAPVFDPLGHVIAAVSISGPRGRIGKPGASRYAPDVKAAAREIEEAFGGGKR